MPGPDDYTKEEIAFAEGEASGWEMGRVQGARMVGHATLLRSDWAAGGWHAYVGFGPQDKASVMAISAALDAVVYSLYF